MKTETKNNSTILIVSCIFFLVLMGIQVTQLHAQISFNLKVVDPTGRPAQGVIITFEDSVNKICPFAVTDQNGSASFQVRQIPELIFAYDGNSTPVYGATTMIINQSKAEYDLTVPFAPRNEMDIAAQINQIYETVRKAYGYYSTLDFVDKASRGIQTSGSSGLGVPGLFSISLLPTFKDGKAMMEVSGTLADFIFGIYHNAMRQIGSITGNDVVFQHGRGRQGY